MAPTYDIAILGGGLTGLAMVHALPAHWRRNTVLIDSAAAPSDSAASLAAQPPGLDDRGTALNRRSLDILEAWGLMAGLREQVGEIRHIEVSQQGYWGTADLETGPGEPAFGAVVSNRQLGAALYQRLQSGPTADQPEIRHESTVANVRFTADRVNLTLQDGEPLSARLLILADGGRSGLGDRLGLSYRQHDYHQVAYTLNLEREYPSDGRAYERFSRDGPRALLPLAGRRQTAVWVVPSKDTLRLDHWTDTDWQQAITECFGYAEGRVTAVSSVSRYPLQFRQVREQARARLAVIGNGALTLHPVAGQGFNLHLRSLYDLGEALQATPDPGNAQVLRQWADRVAQDQRQIAQACHGLVSLFGLQPSMVAHARGLGLAALNGLPGVSKILTQRAMGMST